MVKMEKNILKEKNDKGCDGPSRSHGRMGGCDGLYILRIYKYLVAPLTSRV